MGYSEVARVYMLDVPRDHRTDTARCRHRKQQLQKRQVVIVADRRRHVSPRHAAVCNNLGEQSPHIVFIIMHSTPTLPTYYRPQLQLQN